MYKIYVKNIETGCEWWEYGFSNYIMKRIHFLMNENQVYSCKPKYEIFWCLKLIVSIKTFKKCFMKETKIVKKA